MKIKLIDVEPTVLGDGDPWHAVEIELPSGKTVLVYCASGLNVPPPPSPGEPDRLPHGAGEVDVDGEPVWVEGRP